MKILPATLLLGVLVFFNTGCGGGGTNPSSSSTANVPYSQTDLTVGTGRVAANGNTVFVYYSGWLYNASGTDNKGTLFDTNTSGAGFPFVLGAGRVIKGWDQGVVGMAVGGKRRLVIPPSLAYGSTGVSGVIPPNATLVFDVEMRNVTD